jgi:hypothetical protein
MECKSIDINSQVKWLQKSNIYQVYPNIENGIFCVKKKAVSQGKFYVCEKL